jgi:AAA domain
MGSPGVGKTLSARTYSRWDAALATDWRSTDPVDPTLTTVFYTPSITNTPNSVELAIKNSRARLRNLAIRLFRLEMNERLAALEKRDEDHRRNCRDNEVWPHPILTPRYGDVACEYGDRERAFPDPTSLVVVDEADRLRMASLEQIRAIFDEGKIGLILIGMPGLEKRLARFPQFYSRIGFVHEFRPLGATEIRQLLGQQWVPSGVRLPPQPWTDDAVAAIIRITGGNFRLLNRLLTQMERILEINGMNAITKTVVETARETLVIGQV